jgi:hypothetical protein
MAIQCKPGFFFHFFDIKNLEFFLKKLKFSWIYIRKNSNFFFREMKKKFQEKNTAENPI